MLWSVARSRPGQPLLAVTHRISLYDDVSCVLPDANYGKILTISFLVLKQSCDICELGFKINTVRRNTTIHQFITQCPQQSYHLTALLGQVVVPSLSYILDHQRV